MAAMKVVLKVHIYEEKDRKKALKTVSSLSGIESIAMDMKEKKLTIIGEVDPVQVVERLRKHWHTEIVTIGPAKEPGKKPAAGGGDNKNNNNEESDRIAEFMRRYHYYYNNNYRPYGYSSYTSVEENPNSCVIC